MGPSRKTAVDKGNVPYFGVHWQLFTENGFRKVNLLKTGLTSRVRDFRLEVVLTT